MNILAVVKINTTAMILFLYIRFTLSRPSIGMNRELMIRLLIDLLESDAFDLY